MLFRIEDISGFDPKLRTYDEFTTPTVNKGQIDNYIASKIREEVNGSKNRNLLSYSKSLATCILKYNKYTDNELHICIINGWKDYITYISPEDNVKYRIYYNIQDRINGNTLFNKTGDIQLLDFIIDVSDNICLDKYLKNYTNVGKKIIASPEKDREVVIMNPPNDLVINQYMDAVYILYALQMKYRFLSNANIQNSLISELDNMDAFRFEYCPHERIAFINLILYLSANWQYEYQISKEIYNYSENVEHLSMCYDPILQFHDIIRDSFGESYNLSTYNENIISDLFWKYCGLYLGYCP